MEYESIESGEQSKQQHWDEVRTEIENIVDLLGKPIEDGIKETVIGLCANDIHTTSSCAGHIEKHLAFPYVHVESEGRPQYRYEGEEEIVQNLLQKYQLHKKMRSFLIRKQRKSILVSNVLTLLKLQNIKFGKKKITKKEKSLLH